MSLFFNRSDDRSPGRTKQADRRRAGRNRRALSVEAMETRLLMAGTLSSLTNAAPDGAGTMLLQTDGTVLMQGGGVSKEWYRLTPDSTGGYANGTWTQVASMGNPRLYVGSNVLPDGRMFVIGGEYSGPVGALNDNNTAEMYNPATNTWKSVAPFPQASYGDDPTTVLPDGTILAGFLEGPQTYLYNPTSDTWTQTGDKLRNDSSDEETWIKLPDGSVLSYDVFSSISTGVGHAQRYIPAQKKWVDAGTVPVALSSPAVGYELGGGLLLPDGRVFLIGANGNTAYYTPSTNSWKAGPVIPGGYGSDDAPVAELPNGKLLLTVDTPLFGNPAHAFEFDPTTNTYTDLTSSFPSGYLGGPAYIDRMLVLPTGQVLVGNASPNLMLYTPDSGSLASNVPKISGISQNADGSFTLSGTGLNGTNQGASYGDDVEMDTNYPIVSFTDTSNHVSYARTFGWTSVVATGATPLTTKFTLPVGLPRGSYAVRVIANGAASAPVSLTTPVRQGDPAPTITSPATANPNPTFTASTGLTVLAADTVGESTLTYTWSVSSSPAGVPAPTFASNGTNASKNDTATFYETGAYTFQVTATNLAGLSVSSTVVVNVKPALTSFAITPTQVQLSPGQTQQFTAAGRDQFGNAISASSLDWTLASGGGTVTTTGLYTAPATGTIAVITAGSGRVTASVKAYVLSNPWVTADVGGPSLGGAAGDDGLGTFTSLGAGTDIAGTSDQFRYVYQPLSGDSTIIARVASEQNTSVSAKAGLMYRDGTDPGSPYVMLAVTPGKGLVYQYRTVANGTTTTITTPGLASPLYLKIVRVGNLFTAYYSTNGVNYTQATGVTSVPMSTSANVGLALTSNNASSLNTSIFDHVIADSIPTVSSAASISPSPVTTRTATLSVLGSDAEGESSLTYTWATTTSPAGAIAPSFATNGTNASKSDVVTFSKAGAYTFKVTITNALGYSTTSTVSATVISAQSAVRMTPLSAHLVSGGTQQFYTAVYDQFGLPLAKQPLFTYSLVAGGVGGKVSSTGLYTAPLGRSGVDYVNVTGGGTASVATVTVAFAPSASRVAPSPATVGSVSAGWGASGSSPLLTAADGLRLLPAGRQVDLPWAGVRSLTVSLDKAAPLSPSDVRVAGLAVASYGPVTVGLVPGTASTYLITLARPIAQADRVTVSIANQGLAPYTRRLDVLPGDVNDDGIVNPADASLASGYVTSLFLFADINGDGVVGPKSVKAIQLLNGTKLPLLS